MSQGVIYMPLHNVFEQKLELPIITAPMFLISGPELVIASCKEGVAASFPAPNARTIEVLDQWLEQITGELEAFQQKHPEKKVAPFAVNLIVHPGNGRLNAELDLIEKYQVPFVITSVGNPKKAVERLHEIGTTVFHDVISIKHAHKAISAGVDGLILVCGGAGGHTGSLNPFAFISQVREFWQGTIIVGGAVSNGQTVRAIEILGADLAYVGSRFIATNESMADQQYKDMLKECDADDVILSNKFTGMNANFLKPSITSVGLDPEKFERKDIAASKAQAWKTVWSAGHGVGSIHDVPSVAKLIARMKEEYEAVK